MAKRKLYRYPVYLLARTGAALLAALPRPVLMLVGRYAGRAAYHLISRQRNRALENLRKAYGSEKSQEEIERIAKKSFEHLTLTALELLKFPGLTWNKASRMIDAGRAFETYHDLLKEGHGLISLTAHIGNWELLAGSFVLSGTCSGAVVARRIYFEPYNRWIMGLRAAIGLPTLYRDGSAKELIGILRRNEVIGLLPDQDMDSLKGVFVDYFGRSAYTPEAPVRMALATGAPIVTNFLIRQPDNRYRIVIGGVIRPRIRTTRDEAIQEYTQEWSRQFEAVIRQYPEQWAWMHDRWKTRPVESRMEPSGDSYLARTG